MARLRPALTFGRAPVRKFYDRLDFRPSTKLMKIRSGFSLKVGIAAGWKINA